MIGLIFFVPLFGMAIGAAAGAAGGALSDTGVDDDFMKRLGEELAPGKAALIVLERKVSVDKVLPQIQVSGTVIQTSLSNEDEQALQEALRRRARLTWRTSTVGRKPAPRDPGPGPAPVARRDRLRSPARLRAARW